MRTVWRKGDMLNPLHLAFTILGHILDLIVPRPQARSGPAGDAAASRRVAT